MTEPFDAEAFVARLQKATEEHALVTAQRPAAEQLSLWLGKGAEMLDNAVELLRNIAVLLHDQDPDSTGTWPPNPVSVGATDRGTYERSIASFVASHAPQATHWLDTNPHRNPVLWATGYLRRSYYTIIDCFAGISGLLGREGSFHLRAPIVLARSAFECAAWGAYVTDPDIDANERLRRILNLHFEEVQESLNAGASAEDDDRGRADLIAYAQHCGFTVKTGRQPWMAPVILAPNRNAPDSARHVIDQILPGVGVDMWRSMSAVAHGRSAQVVIPDEHSRPSDLKAWQRVESISWHTLPALLLTQELCSHTEAYLGWETREWGEELQPVAAAFGIAAGLRDAEIRQGLGLGSRSDA